MELHHLAQVGDMNRVTLMVDYLNKLAQCIMQKAYPDFDTEFARIPWLYGAGGKVGLSIDLIAMAAKVPADEIRETGEYIPEIDKGVLFIGYSWDAHTGQVAQDKDETKVAINLEGLAHVFHSLDSDKVPVEHQKAFGELVHQATYFQELVTNG